MIPQTSFMNPTMTGGLQIQNPATTGGMLPPTSFMNPATTGGMMSNTSFGGAAQLQPQATGFGFGNGGNSSTGKQQANLANATADNPFGF
ncbi:unnamed protein product [Pichia kudriavzevii]